MLYFFVSYAHGEQDDLTARFFDDLSAEVREHAGRERGEPVGFRDQHSLRAGDSWPDSLVTALQTSRFFVALISPRYLRSAQCSKEWGVFAERLHRYRQRTGELAPLLIPLFWIRTKLPPTITDIQHTDRSFGPEYERHGLRTLMQLSKHADAYLEFLTSLAVRITAEDAPPVPPLPHPPAFHSADHGFPLSNPDEPDGARVNPGRRYGRPIPRTLPLVGYEDAGDDDAGHEDEDHERDPEQNHEQDHEQDHEHEDHEHDSADDARHWAG